MLLLFVLLFSIKEDEVSLKEEICVSIRRRYDKEFARFTPDVIIVVTRLQ
jgi:hypothetical protein